MRLLGHVIRCPAEDPLYQISFDEEGRQYLYDTRRVGRPRNHWIRETMNIAYNTLYPGEEYIENDEECIFKIFAGAHMRNF